MNKVVFLDRDGTINVEVDYLHKKEDFKFEENADKAIKPTAIRNIIKKIIVKIISHIYCLPPVSCL